MHGLFVFGVPITASFMKEEDSMNNFQILGACMFIGAVIFATIGCALGSRKS